MKKNIFNNNIKKIILHCGRLKKNEKALILFDRKTKNIALDFNKIAKKLHLKLNYLK